MSQTSPPNYMDKVPVKICEKYKPPPKISLPHNLNQRLSSLDEILDPKFVDYDFSLERNVLTKIQEWKEVRETESENRRERLTRYEIGRLREIEEKQKQLLTAVSYPSTDDLSSDEELTPTPATTAAEADTSIPVRRTNEMQSIQFSPSHQNFNTILTPTIVPDALKSKSNAKSNNISKINYSDFENDTSSPFDNIELKTINDLDILAQVLNISTQKHSIINHSSAITTNTDSTIHKDLSKVSPKGDDINSTATIETRSNLSVNTDNDKNLNDNFQYNNIVRADGIYYNNPSCNITTSIVNTGIPQMPPNANVYSHDTTQTTTTTTTKAAVVAAATTSASATIQNCYNTTINMNDNIDFYNFYNNLPNNQNYDSYLYNNYPIDHKNYPNNHHHHHHQIISPVDIDCSNNALQQNINLDVYQNLCTITPNRNAYGGISNNSYSNIKSKSVPDILKELNDEIRDSEIRRNERRRHQDLETYEREYNEISSIKKSSSNFGISDTFMKLSPSSQILAKNISLMGFPLERVCKIAEKFGNDDKKIVEHLIPLSELLDLGFEESKISEALIKFDNNKEKALDFLIS